MKNIQKGFIVPLLLIIIALLLVGGGAYVYTQTKPANQAVTGSVTLPQATSTVQTSGWKTYTNTKYGFEFMYPPKFLLEEREIKLKNVRNEPSDSVSIQLTNGTNVWSLSFFSDQSAVSGGGAVNQDLMTQITVAGKYLYRDTVPHNEGLLDGAIDFCELRKFTSEEQKNAPPTFPFNAVCSWVHVVGERAFSLNYLTRTKDESISEESLQLLDSISKTLTIK